MVLFTQYCIKIYGMAYRYQQCYKIYGMAYRYRYLAALPAKMSVFKLACRAPIQ